MRFVISDKRERGKAGILSVTPLRSALRYGMIGKLEKDTCLFREDRQRMVKPKYYLVDRTLLPEVFQRVIEANEAIASGKAATASEAAKIAGLSRSAYYKYKDGVRPFFEATTDRIVTFHFMLHDQPGVLSRMGGGGARGGPNRLTVNQSIPMRGQASVTIAARTGEMKYSVEELVHRAEALEGVSKVEILASE